MIPNKRQLRALLAFTSDNSTDNTRKLAAYQHGWAATECHGMLQLLAPGARALGDLLGCVSLDNARMAYSVFGWDKMSSAARQKLPASVREDIGRSYAPEAVAAALLAPDGDDRVYPRIDQVTPEYRERGTVMPAGIDLRWLARLKLVHEACVDDEQLRTSKKKPTLAGAWGRISAWRVREAIRIDVLQGKAATAVVLIMPALV